MTPRPHPVRSDATDAAPATGAGGARRPSLWQVAWLLAALAYAVPVAQIAYDRVVDVTRQARTRLIVEYRLWELHPEYRGTPENWTRFAARLLTDRQILRRVHALHRSLADEIELDYRRDLTIAQGEVVLVAAAAWAVPVAAIYALGCWIALRRRAPPRAGAAPAGPAYSEAKYRP